jgi:glyoxylase-like metal-dependent hydrolase (beta-lactamase superfamily II)
MSTSDPRAGDAGVGIATDHEGVDETDLLAANHGIRCVRAANPGPFTLTGTNSWVLERDPCWVVDPGPAAEAHLDALSAEIEARGGLAGIALTHDHSDHSEAVGELRLRHPAPLAAARGEVDVQLVDGGAFGPLQAWATPGHAPDHFALVGLGACFTGDAVLGSGSVFISPDPGAMGGYLRALTRLQLRDDFKVICPGHGPIVWDPQAKLAEYVAHRIDRENRLIAALGEGHRTVAALLDVVWSDVPDPLRGAATVTLAAHLDKLDEEQILPRGVERPRFEHASW